MVKVEVMVVVIGISMTVEGVRVALKGTGRSNERAGER